MFSTLNGVVFVCVCVFEKISAVILQFLILRYLSGQFPVQFKSGPEQGGEGMRLQGARYMCGSEKHVQHPPEVQSFKALISGGRPF